MFCASVWEAGGGPWTADGMASPVNRGGEGTSETLARRQLSGALFSGLLLPGEHECTGCPSPLPSFPHSVGVLKTSALFSPPFFYVLILEGLVLPGGFKYLSMMITIHSPSPTPGLFPEHQASIAACLVDDGQAWHSSPTSPHVCQTCPCMSTIPQHHWELTHNTTQTRTGAHDTLLL